VTREVLLRLKRRVGKERARCERLASAYRVTKDSLGLERAFGEANVLRMVQRFIDDELKKLNT
jgi:hypothetical protein